MKLGHIQRQLINLNETLENYEITKKNVIDMLYDKHGGGQSQILMANNNNNDNNNNNGNGNNINKIKKQQNTQYNNEIMHSIANALSITPRKPKFESVPSFKGNTEIHPHIEVGVYYGNVENGFFLCDCFVCFLMGLCV